MVAGGGGAEEVEKEGGGGGGGGMEEGGGGGGGGMEDGGGAGVEGGGGGGGAGVEGGGGGGGGGGGTGGLLAPICCLNEERMSALCSAEMGGGGESVCPMYLGEFCVSSFGTGGAIVVLLGTTTVSLWARDVTSGSLSSSSLKLFSSECASSKGRPDWLPPTCCLFCPLRSQETRLSFLRTILTTLTTW